MIIFQGGPEEFRALFFSELTLLPSYSDYSLHDALGIVDHSSVWKKQDLVIIIDITCY